MTDPALLPLSLAVAVQSWTFDAVSVAVIVVLGIGYVRCHRRAAGSPGPAGCFVAGLMIWFLATASVIAVYAPVLFWMRAVQVLLLLFVVPFLLALGRPVATVRAALGEPGRLTLDRVLASRWAGIGLSPVTTSIAMLGIPWLLYLTPWYVASMSGAAGTATRITLVVIGFGYYYARLQTDPVPRRYSPLLSIVISIAETLGDGLLGLVLWLGPLIAYSYYAGLNRTWGPSLRTDQSVGAGILWILGDVLGLPFLMVLLRSLSTHERQLADEVDDELDHTHVPTAREVPAAQSNTLWWMDDPQLRERFGSS